MDINLNFFTFSKKIHVNWHWVQLAVVIVTLLVSTAVSFWGSRQQILLLSVLVGGIGGFIILSKHPGLGICLIFMGGMFVPFTGPGGINAAVLMSALVFGLWIIDMLIIKRRFFFLQSRIVLLIVVFVILSLLSFVMGQIPWFEFANQAPLDSQIGGLAIFILSATTLLVTAHVLKDIRWLEWTVWSFIALGGLYIFSRFIDAPFPGRLYQTGFTAGSMFWTWMVALTLGQVIFNVRLQPRYRVLLAIVPLMTLYVAFVQGYDWKSGWVPPLVVVAVFLGLRFPKIATFAIPFGILLAVYLSRELIASDEYSWGTRLDAWVIVLEISKVSPLFGMGFSNYYWYTPLFPIRGWRVNFNSHSQLVDIVAQTGIIGLLIFLWIFTEVALLGWNLSQRLPDGFGRAYAYSVIGGIAGTLMASLLVDWVLPFVYNIGLSGFRASILPWIFMGGLVALEHIFKPSGASMELLSTKSRNLWMN